MKDQFRTEAKKRLQSIDKSEKAQASLRIQQQLKILLQEQGGTWAGYQPLADEPTIEWSELSSGVSWVFPVIEKNQDMSFRKSTRTLAISKLGTKEPQNGEAVDLRDITGVVLPGLGFDRQGYRLGRGGGYYDKALSHYPGLKIGLCFAVNFFENLPSESHDVRCGRVITENNIYHTEGVSLCK